VIGRGAKSLHLVPFHYLCRIPASPHQSDDERPLRAVGADLSGVVHSDGGTFRRRRRMARPTATPTLIEFLEAQDRSPAVMPITETLHIFDAEHVQAAWQKALDRRAADPEGAITAARTLLETVCKHVLEDSQAEFPDDADLPKLWALASEQLNLAPQQHQENVFKAILGNCQAVVNNLGAIRNRIGDAHGQGRRPVRPKPHHAELAVNLAGTMAALLVATWQEQQGGG
jgi:hypothetical protein